MSEQVMEQTAVDRSASRSFEYDKVKTLYDSTKFHIGLYLAPGTLLVAAIGAKTPFSFRHSAMWVAVKSIGVAGLAGGVIASTSPECDTLTTFPRVRNGPWGLRICTGETCTRIEHTAFWFGIVVGALPVAFPAVSPPIYYCYRPTNSW